LGTVTQAGGVLLVDVWRLLPVWFLAVARGRVGKGWAGVSKKRPSRQRRAAQQRARVERRLAEAEQIAA